MDIGTFLKNIDDGVADSVLNQGLQMRAQGLWWNFEVTEELLDDLVMLLKKHILGKQPLIIYPASQICKSVLARLDEDDYQPWLRFFVDTYHQEDRFQDFPAPVLGPEALAKVGDEQILIFHPFAETAIERTVRAYAPEGANLFKFFQSDLYKRFIEDKMSTKVTRLLLDHDWDQKHEGKDGLEPLRVVMINNYGPSIVLPELLERCSNPGIKIIYLHPAALPFFKNRDVDALPCSCLWECSEVIQAADPDLLYIQDNSLYSYQKAPVIKAGFPQLPIIYEAYDLITAMYADPMQLLAEGRKPEDITYALRIEEHMLGGCDGVIHMDNGPQIDAIMAQTESNHLEFHAYLPQRVFHFQERECGRPIHLAWAGGIAPDTAPDGTRGENKLLSFFKSLIAQGFRVTAFNALAADHAHLEEEYANYLAYQAEEPMFRIFPYTARETLIEILSREVDYGMHLYPKPKNDDARAHMYQSSMAGKVFTYMSAGIPMLVCDFLEPISRFVKAHEVGVSIGEFDFDRIGEILQAADYGALKQNVKKLVPSISTEANMPRLEAFLRTSLKRADARGAKLSERARAWLSHWEANR